MAFFSANELFSFDGVSQRAPPWLGTAATAVGGRKPTAVDRARARMAEAKAKCRPEGGQGPVVSMPLSSYSMFSASSLNAAQIIHRNLEPPTTIEVIDTNDVREMQGRSSAKGIKRPLSREDKSHPCMQNAPTRDPYGRGSEVSLDIVGMDEEAVISIRSKELAATTTPTVNAR